MGKINKIMGREESKPKKNVLKMKAKPKIMKKTAKPKPMTISNPAKTPPKPKPMMKTKTISTPAKTSPKPKPKTMPTPAKTAKPKPTLKTIIPAKAKTSPKLKPKTIPTVAKTAKPKPTLPATAKASSKQKKQNKKTATPEEPISSGETEKLDDQLLRSGIKALHSLIEKQPDEKKKPLERIQLQVNLVKVPKSPGATLFIPLPHSFASKENTICLITGNVQENEEKCEKTVKHYEDLLKENKVSVKIDKIITSKQLNGEYSEPASKRLLAQSYDFFLTDDRVHRHVLKKLKEPIKRQHKNLVAVDLSSNLNDAIKEALCKVHFPLQFKGNSFMINVALAKMTQKQIMDNVKVAFEGLGAHLPGGKGNIRSLRVKTASTMSIPIYESLKSKSEINIPERKTPKRKIAEQTITPANKIAKSENGKKAKLEPKQENSSNSEDEDEDEGSDDEEVDNSDVESDDEEVANKMTRGEKKSKRNTVAQPKTSTKNTAKHENGKKAKVVPNQENSSNSESEELNESDIGSFDEVNSWNSESEDEQDNTNSESEDEQDNPNSESEDEQNNVNSESEDGQDNAISGSEDEEEVNDSKSESEDEV